MAVSFAVSEIRFVEGTVMAPPANGMTLFIGPNNCGKTALLRELSPRITNPAALQYPPLWIRQVLSSHEGSAEDFLLWAKGRGHRSFDVYGEAHLRGGTNAAGSLSESDAKNWWTLGEYDYLHSLLVTAQWTDRRLQGRSDSQRWDHAEPAAEPVQFLYEDPALLKVFAAYTREAFGKEISVDWTVPGLQLRVGATGIPDIAPPTPELVAAYRRLPPLVTQGDGFRAFVEILLNTVLRPTPVIVIDEPEAFLHPPQARLLGRILAQLPGQTQMFVATHSADFLAGVLEAEQARPVSIVRLDRSSGTSAARLLNPDAVQGLLRTPLLRYSNLSSGLFYDRVVLCEAAGDCQFYAAAFDATKDAGAAHDNTLFLHTSGKAPLADTARRLRQCGIPTAVIADFDYLRSGLARAVTSLAGVTEHLDPDLKCLREHAAGSRSETSAGGFKTEMNALLKGVKASDPLPDRVLGELTKLAKGGDRWGDLKKSGLAGLQGDPYNAAERLLQAAADFGLFVVPCGELESWVRQVPRGDKGLWSQKVFNDGWHAKPTDELKAFCSGLRAYLRDGAADYARAAAQALQVSSRLDREHAVVTNSSDAPLTEVRVIRATYTHGGRHHIQPLWGTPESKTFGVLPAGDEFSVPLFLMSDGEGYEGFLPQGSADQELMVHFRDRAGLWWERIGDKPPTRLPSGPSEPDPEPQ
ncbi:ATP-dependent nuclease [Streptomyces virginiae]|uniref:ATP-dependent nuclease n=1 Tax=Streptomyces virginiae TaxID=1961 RepID=UPI00365DF6DD